MYLNVIPCGKHLSIDIVAISPGITLFNLTPYNLPLSFLSLVQTYLINQRLTKIQINEKTIE